MLDAEVDQAALAGDARPEEDVELRLLERRRHLVLDDLDPRAVAHGIRTVLECLDAADVEAHGGVELERLASRGGLRAAEEHPDLLSQLVDEDYRGLGLAEATGELAERLGHEPGLEADVGVAHLALDFGAGHERGDRVDDDEVDRAGADQHVGDLERLLPRVWLGDQQRVDVDAQGPGVFGIEGVLRVDECRDAAGTLGVGDGVQGEGGLTRGLRTVDLHDPAAGKTADAERDIQGDRTGGDHGDGGAFIAAEAHDGTLAELTVDLGECCFQGLFAVCC